MARPTRTADPVTKKRKRNSSPHDKPLKVHRSSQHKSLLADSTLPQLQAHNILDVLEKSDSQGLLDRVFPLSDQSLSLRSLFANAQQHSLRVLRAAIHNLLPLSSHPRSKPSQTASQQLHFCNLALSLLDQASRHILPTSLDSPSLFPHHSPDPPPDHPKSPPSPSLSKRRYALVQHLPSGDYWSSLNSERPSSPTPLLKDLPTAHAELVSIFPTPSSSLSSKQVPTLASYGPTKLHPKKALPAQRRLTTGAFLYYGPWASFAPSFDHDCELVGRRELGEALWYKRERKIQREAELRDWIEGGASIEEVGHTDKDIVHGEPFGPEDHLDGILPPEIIQNLKAALDNAELENLVDELLTRNQRALVRLQELQIDRLTKEDSAATAIDEASEEWEIAHGIMESLETLTSLRPRAASGEIVSIVPPTSVLRKLHKTLALEPCPGWHGTLTPTKATALRDDSTVKVRATSTAPATVSTSSSPAPTSVTPAASTTAPTTTPYTGYTYAYQAQQAQAYRPVAAATSAATYTAYKPGATSYYQNYMQGTQQQQQQYYGQQAYGAGATSQQPYAAYSNWFAHAHYSQAAAAATAGAASTGRGTPQPAAAATAYGSYYQQPQQQRTAGSTTGAAATTPAVANTVAMNKAGTGVATGAWVGYTGQPQGGVAPTLPIHVKATAGAPAANGYQPQQQQNYYGTYQVQQPAQQSTTK